LPNVHFLDRVDIEEVPHYVKNFDIGLIPYKQDEESDYICPMKLFDYLAAGIPVAAISIPAVRKLESFVHVAEHPGSLEAAVRDAMKDTSPPKTQARIDFARKNSWSVRMEKLSQILESQLGQASATSSPLLPGSIGPSR
jgi:glycosyltransferase involved in cell wall biosynthesis